MKIEIERVGGGPVILAEFAERHGLTMRVVERHLPHMAQGLKRYFASFDKVEVTDGRMLSSITGNGDTPEEAVRDYAYRIRGQRLAFGAYTPERREFTAPNEWLGEDEKS